MKRLYDAVIEAHFAAEDEMLFLSGPRQVGKTTVSQHAGAFCNRFIYLNWDNEDHQRLILSGPSAIIQYANMARLSTTKPIIQANHLQYLGKINSRICRHHLPMDSSA